MKKLLASPTLQHWLQVLFPPHEVYARQLPFKTKWLLFGGLLILFTLLGSFMPSSLPLAYDWNIFFSAGRIQGFYPPWAAVVVSWLTWPLLVGVTLTATTMAAFLRAVSPLSLVATLFALPFLWVLFLGQLDGFVLLGLLGLPWLVPFVLMKPHIGVFALGARWQYLLAAGITFIVSLIIWGWWPAIVFNTFSQYTVARGFQDIALGWWGLPVALVLFWFSRGDMDMLMASGAFIAPYLVVYNLLPITPAVARLRPRAAFIASFCSWLTLSSNWLGDWGWWLGWVFVSYLWLGLAAKRYPKLYERLKLKWIGL